MSVATTTNKIPYTLTTGSQALSIPFLFPENAHIKLIRVATETLPRAVMVLGVDYTLTGAANPAGGTLTTIATVGNGFTVGTKLVIKRELPITQPTSYSPNDAFPAKVHEGALDRGIMIAQQSDEQSDRAIRFPEDDSRESVLPSAVDRANKVIVFDAEGDVSVAPFVDGSGIVLPNSIGEAELEDAFRERSEVSVAAMKARSYAGAVNNQRIKLLGYYTAGDGGGGQFYVDKADTTTADNGGTVIVASDGTRLKRVQVCPLDVKMFGAKCDGSTDGSAAVQLAVNYCATFTQWPALRVSGRCRLASSVNIDRLVDTMTSEFLIYGDGEGAGFYTSGNVTMFDSTISVTNDPKSEFVKFKNVHFETSSVSNSSYVLSKKFLRIKFVDCFFFKIRCVNSDIYAQTLHFIHCNIRNNPASFLTCKGLYDVDFPDCIIENGSTIVDCRDSANIKGALGLRFRGGVIEGIGGSIAILRGAQSFIVESVHMEANATPWFNLNDVGTMTNSSVVIKNNVCVCSNASDRVVYYGLTDKVVSFGNTIFTGRLHENVVAVTDLVSSGDVPLSGGAIADTASTHYSTVNGVYRAGPASAVWSDSDNHLSKDASGRFGFGFPVQAASRVFVSGEDQTSSKFSATFSDSAGNTILALRNDRYILIGLLGNYANDAAAAAGGVPIGAIYRNGSILMIRVS